MNQIDNLSGDANQLSSLILPDGTEADITLIYRPATLRWTLNLVYGARTINGLTLCAHPNLLRPWAKLIPFGLACVTTDGADPISQDDFTSGRATLYLLDTSDLATIETSIFGTPT